MKMPKIRARASTQVSRIRPASMPSGMPTLDGHDHRGHGELERGRPVLGDDLGHRSLVGQRRAEVPGEDLPQVIAVLDDERPVVAGGPLPDGQLGLA